MHPIHVIQWKRKLLNGASDLFTRGEKKKDKEDGQGNEAELFQNIGKLRWSWSGLKRSQLL